MKLKSQLAWCTYGLIVLAALLVVAAINGAAAYFFFTAAKERKIDRQLTNMKQWHELFSSFDSALNNNFSADTPGRKRTAISFSKEYIPDTYKMLELCRKTGNLELIQNCQKYLLTASILGGKKQLFFMAMKNAGQEVESFRDSLFQTCPMCINGAMKCEYCNDTRICIRCNGTGKILVTDLTPGSGNGVKKNLVNCPKTCTMCPQGRCRRCSGTGKITLTEQSLLRILDGQRKILLESIRAYEQSMKQQQKK